MCPGQDSLRKFPYYIQVKSHLYLLKIDPLARPGVVWLP